MDFSSVEESGIGGRSFRNEDYNTRRVFLRSYTLPCKGEGEEEQEKEEKMGRALEDGEENGIRTRSFRTENYDTRRVFLRSYPLHWGGEEEEEDKQEEKGEEEKRKETMRVSKEGARTKRARKILPTFLHWGGGKVLVLRKYKHKIAYYLVACHPFGFKPSTALISV